MGRGRFDTRRRYIRKVDANGDFAMATGPTLSIIGSGNTGVTASGRGSWVQEELGWRWRYSCAGYTKQTLGRLAAALAPPLCVRVYFLSAIGGAFWIGAARVASVIGSTPSIGT